MSNLSSCIFAVALTAPMNFLCIVFTVSFPLPSQPIPPLPPHMLHENRDVLLSDVP